MGGRNRVIVQRLYAGKKWDKEQTAANILGISLQHIVFPV